MSIVSSIIAADDLQKDGRRWIRELHTDHIGVQYLVTYLGEAVTNASAVMAARAAQINAGIEASEIVSNVGEIMTLGSQAAPVTNYSTGVQNFEALREVYRLATRTEAIFIGDFLSSLTNAQLQAAFSMTAGQVTTLRANKLTPAATLAASIRSAAGQ
jgi:hypothetical protein